jgi:hypothetical protein
VNRASLWLVCFLELIASRARAVDYGYIMVSVEHQNPKHFTPVQLYANGVALGPGFSHASKGFSWTPIQAANLSRAAKITPITASYSQLEVGCEFNFYVSFSMDGVTALQKWGPFHAPAAANAGSIPLSISCGDHLDRLCSSDQQLETRIRKDYNKAAMKRYNDFKTDYDLRMAERAQHLNSASDELSRKMAEAPPPDFSKGEAALAAKIVDWERQTNQIIQEYVEKDEAKGDNAAADLPDTNKAAKDAEKLAREEARDRAIETGTADGSIPSTLAAGFLSAHKFIDGWVDREKDFQDGLRDGTGENDDLIADSERAVKIARQSQKEIFGGEAFADVAAKLVQAAGDLNSTVGLSVKVCEIIGSHENCSGSKLLSDDERAAKICELMLRFIPVWHKISEYAKELPTDDVNKKFVEKMEDKVETGFCKKVVGTDPSKKIGG